MLNKKLSLVTAVSYTIFVVVASLTTVQIQVAPSIAHKDKIVHIGIYLVYTILWFVYYNFDKKKPLYLKVTLFAFITGLVIELLQGALTKTRTADIYDVLANSIGIGIALLIIHYFYPKIKNRI